jgi:hypothetical protein
MTRPADEEKSLALWCVMSRETVNSWPRAVAAKWYSAWACLHRQCSLVNHGHECIFTVWHVVNLFCAKTPSKDLLSRVTWDRGAT